MKFVSRSNAHLVILVELLIVLPDFDLGPLLLFVLASASKCAPSVVAHVTWSLFEALVHLVPHLL